VERDVCCPYRGTEFQVFVHSVPCPIAAPDQLSWLTLSGLSTKGKVAGEVEYIVFLEEGKHRFVTKFPGFAHSLVLRIRSFEQKSLE
jgi:hypothetical protein